MDYTSILAKCLAEPNRKALIMSKNYRRSLQVQEDVRNNTMAKNGVFNISQRSLDFPNGSKISFAYIDCECALNKFHSIRVDELDTDNLEEPMKSLILQTVLYGSGR